MSKAGYGPGRPGLEHQNSASCLLKAMQCHTPYTHTHRVIAPENSLEICIYSAGQLCVVILVQLVPSVDLVCFSLL